MPRFSRAYSDFAQRIEEVRQLMLMSRTLAKSFDARDMQRVNALCRSATVLLSSHLEGYVKEIGEIALESIQSTGICRSRISPRMFYYISQARIEDIQNLREPDRISEHIFSFQETEATYWVRNGPFSTSIDAEKFHVGFSNPRFDKISSYFRRFGYETYKKDFYTQLKSNAQIIENTINEIVSLRNNIAHGDLSLIRTPLEISSYLEKSYVFVRTTDDIFCRWFKKNYVSLRT